LRIAPFTITDSMATLRPLLVLLLGLATVSIVSFVLVAINAVPRWMPAGVFCIGTTLLILNAARADTAWRWRIAEEFREQGYGVRVDFPLRGTSLARDTLGPLGSFESGELWPRWSAARSVDNCSLRMLGYRKPREDANPAGRVAGARERSPVPAVC
jgi:hypothetical protein